MSQERGGDTPFVEALRARRPLHCERMQRGRAVHHRSGRVPSQQGCKPFRLHRGGHGHEHEVLPQLPQLREHPHEQVRLHAPLVHLVQHHGRGPGQFRVLQQSAQQDAGGHELHPSGLRRPALAPHAPADDAARLRHRERGQPARGGPSGHPAGLNDDDAAGDGISIRTGRPYEVFPDRVGHHRRHESGFARPGRGLHHGRAPAQRLLQSRHGLRERQAPADPADVERGGTHGFQYDRALGRDC